MSTPTVSNPLEVGRNRRIRKIRLPDRFYLPRRLPNGLKVRDVMPWRNAVEYITDGEAIGMRMHDGEILWIKGRQEALLEAVREDLEGVDLHALVRGLQEYTRLHPRLKYLWQEDIAALEDLLAEREAEGWRRRD